MFRQSGSSVVANEKSKQVTGSIGVTMLACGQETEHCTLLHGDRGIAGRKPAVAGSCVRRQQVMDACQRLQCVFGPAHAACKPCESLQTGVRV